VFVVDNVTSQYALIRAIKTTRPVDLEFRRRGNYFRQVNVGHVTWGLVQITWGL